MRKRDEATTDSIHSSVPLGNSVYDSKGLIGFGGIQQTETLPYLSTTNALGVGYGVMQRKLGTEITRERER